MKIATNAAIALLLPLIATFVGLFIFVALSDAREDTCADKGGVIREIGRGFECFSPEGDYIP